MDQEELRKLIATALEDLKVLEVETRDGNTPLERLAMDLAVMMHEERVAKCVRGQLNPDQGQLNPDQGHRCNSCGMVH